MRSGFGSHAAHPGETVVTFYLRDIAPAKSPTAGEKSAAHPASVGGVVMSVISSGASEKSLSKTKGSSQSTITVKSNDHSPQELYVGRFSSGPLAAGTISAQTVWWYMNFTEQNSNANSHLQVPVVYAWRPSTNAVVGYLLDSASYDFWGPEFGNGNPNTKYGLVQDYTAGISQYTTTAVTVQNDDILVVEIFLYSMQGAHKKFDNTLYYNGTTEPTAGSAEVSSASKIAFLSGIHMA